MTVLKYCGQFIITNMIEAIIDKLLYPTSIYQEVQLLFNILKIDCQCI